MKDILKKLYVTNKRHFEVWNYLWLMSEDGITEFSYTDICAKFKVPKSTLVRILQLEREWNEDNVQTEVERLEKNHRVTFFEFTNVNNKKQSTPRGAKRTTVKKPQKVEILDVVLEETYTKVKEQYDKRKIHYSTIEKDKKVLRTIINKIENLLIVDNDKLADEDIIAATVLFFKKIPNWWWINAFKMRSINKNFDTIYNQIKLESNGKKNSRVGSYAEASSSANQVDYSTITNRGKESS